MDRRMWVLIAAVAALSIAALLFKVRVMIAGGKYLIAIVAILLLVGMAARALGDRDR
jgi:hypothetical protein